MLQPEKERGRIKKLEEIGRPRRKKRKEFFHEL
jgi:hypothetical protein